MATHHETSILDLFTPEQLDTLRVQIYAFKMLSKSMIVPLHLQELLFLIPDKSSTEALTEQLWEWQIV
jgi:hypothetical protein